MKKENRLFIMGCLLCMIISIAGICFSFAWYAIHPTYTDIQLQVGDNSLDVSTKLYLRKQNNDGTLTYGGTLGSDYNCVSVVDKQHIINPEGSNHGNTVTDIATGKITYTLPAFTFNLFSELVANNGLDGGLLDKDSLSWNIDYLTIMIGEATFSNKFFDSYLTAEYTMSIKNLVSTDTDLNNYVDSLFNIRIIEDINGQVEEEVTPNPTATPYLADGFRNSMLGTPSLTSGQDNYHLDNIKELESYKAGPGKPEDPNFKKLTTSTTPVDLLSGTKVGNASVISPNDNNKDNTTKYYSRALCFSISIDPLVLMEFFAHETTKGDTKFTLSFNLDFKASNIKF